MSGVDINSSAEDQGHNLTIRKQHLYRIELLGDVNWEVVVLMKRAKKTSSGYEYQLQLAVAIGKDDSNPATPYVD